MFTAYDGTNTTRVQRVCCCNNKTRDPRIFADGDEAPMVVPVVCFDIDSQNYEPGLRIGHFVGN